MSGRIPEKTPFEGSDGAVEKDQRSGTESAKENKPEKLSRSISKKASQFFRKDSFYDTKRMRLFEQKEKITPAPGDAFKNANVVTEGKRDTEQIAHDTVRKLVDETIREKPLKKAKSSFFSSIFGGKKSEKAEDVEETKVDKKKEVKVDKKKEAKAEKKEKTQQKQPIAAELSKEEQKANLFKSAGNLIKAISNKKNLSTEVGTFRIQGSEELVKPLMVDLAKNPNASLDKSSLNNSDLSIHELTTALKRILADQTVLDGAFGTAYIKLGEDIGDEKPVDVDSLAKAFEKLDPNKKELLRNLFDLCTSIAKHSDINKMAPTNLALTPGTLLVEGKNPLSDGPRSVRAFVFFMTDENYKKILK